MQCQDMLINLLILRISLQWYIILRNKVGKVVSENLKHINININTLKMSIFKH